MPINNVDDILLHQEHPTQVKIVPDNAAAEVESLPLDLDNPNDPTETYQSTPEEIIGDNPYIQAAQEADKADAEPEGEVEHDDYGNKVDKKERMYTQAEVQEMMRDRLSRGRHSEQMNQQEMQSAPVQQDDQSTADWQKELDIYIERTLEKREKAISQKQWQAEESAKQAQFEVKFNESVAKYPDFERVVSGKPLTPQMVMATRNMADPAAFIYAASKTQAVELARIAGISDPYAQAVEIGRLEERMRKSAKVSNTPAPASKSTPDFAEKKSSRNIDALILKDAGRYRR